MMHSISRIALLVNPYILRKGRKVLREVIYELNELNILYDLFEKEWPDSPEMYSDVWIVGGDGTLNYALNKYPMTRKPIVIFKGGTGNDFAWKLYGNTGVKDQLHIALSSSPVATDLAKCNGRIYANSAGFGFDGEVLRSINAVRFLGGHAGYLGIVLRKIFTYKEVNFQVRTQDGFIENKFLLVIINNSSRTGGGFLVTPDADLNDGKLDLLLCESLPVLKRLKYLPVIQKGNHGTLSFISCKQEEKIFIKTREEIFAQLDGELIRGNEFTVEALPAAACFRYSGKTGP